MNLFKTALRNVRKSSKDYSVYFFTLIIGVAIFYMFNSVGSQHFMSDIMKSESNATKMVVILIEVISVGVAMILGLLMVYANNFLIKRRKKEFGIYLMLGMSIRRVSAILSIETLLVGLISLVAGLVAGIFGSQLLSIAVGKMFAVNLTSYRFSISGNIAIKTIVYFFILFFVVMIFNTKTVSKYKLIDLLNAKKSAEKRLVRSTKVSVCLFILAMILLVFAYVEIGFRGSDLMLKEFIISIVMGVVGTFFFFFSLAGFLPELLRKFKGFYFKKLNAFVSAQFSHNLNSSAIAFSVISIMLFFAITAFSVGFSMNGYLNHRLKDATPVDVSAAYWGSSVSQFLEDNGVKTEEIFEDSLEIAFYHTDEITMKAPVAAAFDTAQSVFFSAKWDSPENIVRLSDYNKLEALYGRKNLELGTNEYVVVCDFDMLTDIINEAIKNGNTIPIGDRVLTSGYDAAVEEYVLMSGMTAQLGVIVLPDELFDIYPEKFVEEGSVFVGNYKENSDALLTKIFTDADARGETAIISKKTEVINNSVGTSVSVVFIVLYIGTIFIITSAAVIALKILSDSMDSSDKYDVLMKIGADYDMRKKALFIQVLLNFAAPLIIGILHSVFALRYMKGLLRAIGISRMFSGAVAAAIIMLLIYGGYALITYSVSKRVVE